MEWSHPHTWPFFAGSRLVWDEFLVQGGENELDDLQKWIIDEGLAWRSWGVEFVMRFAAVWVWSVQVTAKVISFCYGQIRRLCFNQKSLNSSKGLLWHCFEVELEPEANWVCQRWQVGKTKCEVKRKNNPWKSTKKKFHWIFEKSVLFWSTVLRETL